MDHNDKAVIEDAETEVERILNATGAIRDAYAAGRPNSAPALNIESALSAFEYIVSNFTPGYSRVK